MDDSIAPIVAGGRALLPNNRYDEALGQLQRIRKLRPGDKALMDRLAGEVESRRNAAERLAAQRDEASTEAIRLEIAREQEAQQRAADERRRLEAERRRLEVEGEAAWRAAQTAPRRPLKQTNTFGAVGAPAQGDGILVLGSNAGTPAAGLGLEYGDVIDTIKGRAVNTEAESFTAVRSSPDDRSASLPESARRSAGSSAISSGPTSAPTCNRSTRCSWR